MTNTKHTKKELFGTLLVFASAAEADAWVIEGIEHEIDLLNKRSSSGKVDAKHAAKVAADTDAVVSVLSTTEGKRAGDIAKEIDFSVQKVTALLKKLVDSGMATRTTEKKVTTFTLAE